MATKDFGKLSNKKLQALLSTASEEDKVAIQAVLDARSQSASQVETQGNYTQTKVGESTVVEAAPEAELSPEEQAMLDAAEKAAEKGEKQTTSKKSLSEDEIAALVAKAKENVGHKCEILPFGEIDWVPGYIASVVLDKRSNNIMYRIKSGDKYSHKEISAKTLRIFEELAEIPARSTTTRASSEKRSDDEAEKLLEDSKANKGRYITIGEGEKAVKVLIVGVMRDKRSNAVMYKIRHEDKREQFKVVNASDIVLLDEWDEDIKARAERAASPKKSKAEQLTEATEKLEKAKAQVAKLEELIAALEAAVAEESAAEGTTQAEDNDLM